MGNNYLESYGQRMKNNHITLMQVADMLKLKGCKVYSSEFRDSKRDSYRKYLLVVKDNKKTYVGFSEVPYRWWLDSECSNRKNTRGLVGEKGYGFPYTIEEILDSMRTIQKSEREFQQTLRSYVEL